MKFCMVTTFFPPYNFGGDGIYVYRLTNALARQGHTIDVIHCEDAFLCLQPKGPQGVFPCHPNVRVHRLKSALGILSPLITQQTGSSGLKKHQIRQIMEGGNFDVIHYHNMSLMGLTALGYGRAIKLYTMHEHWLVCPMHVLWKNNKELCKSKSCFVCSIAWKRPPQFWRYGSLLENTVRTIDYFISPSRFTMTKHLEMGFNHPIMHIPYFLPLKASNNPQAHQTDAYNKSTPMFLFVGRLEKIKGLQNLFPVFAKRQQYRLVIAGDGTYGTILRHMAEGMTNVNFLGSCNFEQLSDLYMQATAVIVPSICYEVFGIIIIEAFSYRTPVIVNNLGALPEVVHDSQGGIVFSNEDELCQAIDRIAADRSLRNELGQNGYHAYLKYWTEDYHFERYYGLITQIQRQKKSETAALALKGS